MTKSKMAEEIGALRERAWTPEDARRVLGACAARGKTQAAFAHEHGLGQKRLRYWRSRLGRDRAAAAVASTAMVRFVPAVVKPAPRTETMPAAVIRLPCGAEVEIAEASAHWVSAMVRDLCEAGSWTCYRARFGCRWRRSR